VAKLWRHKKLRIKYKLTNSYTCLTKSYI